MGRRRQAREIAFKVIFQVDLGKLDPEEVIRHSLLPAQASPEVTSYAERLIRGVVAEQAHLDRLLAQRAERWELDRLLSVDRNLLRMAAYELLHCPEVPKSVVINEAIELAKKYSGADSGGFINALLDKVLPTPAESDHPPAKRRKTGESA
ncbi:MAG: transcription antitermination factor NusB [candidate division FCPU426 bacterium]